MSRLAALTDTLDRLDLFPPQGSISRVGQTHVEADGPLASIGDLCRIRVGADRDCLAEVSAVDARRIVLVPLDSAERIRPGMAVTAERGAHRRRSGDAFRGRVIDGLGRPIDGQGPIPAATTSGDERAVVAPLDRLSPTKVLPTGISAIDALLTIGIGQRIGIFSASGVGKSSLIQQLARQVECDHVIVCLVGERGREVEGFWREHLAETQDSKVTIVAATSDAPAPMRVRAVDQALLLAEHWRSIGRHVVLIIDSITRYAMALREIGLAAGEPPTLRGYTPNVLSALPRLVERCGCQRGAGAITGLFTVLSETDDVDDPIVEVMKSLLDGHIILSRSLAQRGQFPAIDVSRSISRLAAGLMSAQHRADAQAVLGLLARFDESRVLIESGLYVKGSDPGIDHAIARRPAIMAFLAQPMDENRAAEASVAALGALHKGGAHG